MRTEGPVPSMTHKVTPSPQPDRQTGLAPTMLLWGKFSLVVSSHWAKLPPHQVVSWVHLRPTEQCLRNRADAHLPPAPQGPRAQPRTAGPAYVPAHRLARVCIKAPGPLSKALNNGAWF